MCQLEQRERGGPKAAPSLSGLVCDSKLDVRYQLPPALQPPVPTGVQERVIAPVVGSFETV